MACPLVFLLLGAAVTCRWVPVPALWAVVACLCRRERLLPDRAVTLLCRRVVLVLARAVL